MRIKAEREEEDIQVEIQESRTIGILESLLAEQARSLSGLLERYSRESESASNPRDQYF